MFRLAWRQAAAERFVGQEITELNVEIDEMVDSLIMDLPLPRVSPRDFH
ncbi:hypothetical protein [Brevundimonas sp.]|nr:hypothetical protein [Brevundimonas sp.]